MSPCEKALYRLTEPMRELQVVWVAAHRYDCGVLASRPYTALLLFN